MRYVEAEYIFVGSVVNDNSEGKGWMLYTADNSFFEGMFSNDMANGQGSFTLGDGRKFEGMFTDGVFEDGNNYFDALEQNIL